MVGKTPIFACRFPAPPLEGLSGAAGDLPWVGRTLAQRQEEALREAGIPLVDSTQRPEGAAWILLREDAAVTAAALKALAAAGIVERADLRWVGGGQSGALAAAVALGEDAPVLGYLAPGAPPDPARLLAARPAVIDPLERVFPLPLPAEGGPAPSLALSERLALPTRHWLQLLWANLLGMPPILWQQIVGRTPLSAALRLLWAALRARSLQPGRVAARLGQRGRGCRVHPSAVVEGCWLGDKVEIGAGAVVRGAVLGDGVHVEDLALVEFSVLAPGARVQRQAMMKFSLAREGTALGGVMQLGVLDRGAAVKRGAYLMDMALGHGVRVRAGGRLAPAPLGLAGVCVGEGTTVGCGVHVAAGRLLPPGLQIVAESGLLARIPEDARGRVVVRGGTLEDL